MQSITKALVGTVAAGAMVVGSATPAFAQDNRLVERMYDPAEVVRVEGKAGVQATIRFAEDEHIENVAIGDSEAWQVTPNKRANLLFVKPLAPTAATNMTVVTDRRTYLFDLVASASAKPPHSASAAFASRAETPMRNSPVRTFSKAQRPVASKESIQPAIS